MSQSLTLTGMDNLRRIFKDYPEKGYRQPVITAFRKAAAPVRSAMLQKLPANLKPAKKALKVKPGKGKSMTLAVGFFAGQGIWVNRKGQKRDPWQLLYWHNYGTLQKRTAISSLHTFKTPRKQKTASWSGGIGPGFFVEKAWEQSKAAAQTAFEKSFEEESKRFLEKNALK